MKTVVILGAGQMGKAAAGLLNPAELELMAFGDNSEAARTTPARNAAPSSTPILSIEEALALAPDIALIAVSDPERAAQLQTQAQAAGFRGTFLFLWQLRQQFSIRTATLRRIVRRLEEQDVPGAIAELGVYKGDTARLLNTLMPHRTLYLFDTFAGFTCEDTATEAQMGLPQAHPGDFSDTSVQYVLDHLPFPQAAVIKQGHFPQTAEGLNETFALVSLDADLYAPTLAGLAYFYPRLAVGGVIVLHDYDSARFPGVKQAVADYESRNGQLLLLPLCDLHGTAVIIKPGQAQAAGSQ